MLKTSERMPSPFLVFCFNSKHDAVLWFWRQWQLPVHELAGPGRQRRPEAQQSVFSLKMVSSLTRNQLLPLNNCLPSDCPVHSMPQFCVKSMFNRQTGSETERSLENSPGMFPWWFFLSWGLSATEELPLPGWHIFPSSTRPLPWVSWYSDDVFKAICSVFTGEEATL